MADDTSTNSDLTYTPPPPQPPKLYQVVILSVYHILLALFLAYALYKVWPPQPWPGDRAKAEASNANRQAAANSNAAKEDRANLNARPGTATGAGTNANAASGNSSNASSAGNTNTSAGTNTNSTGTSTNSAANTNATTGGGTGAGAGNTSSAGASNANSNANSAAGASDVSYTESKEVLPPPFHILGFEFQPTLEVRLILLVLLVGAIGSYVHSASSIVDYLGNRTFISSWVWWYLLRPFIGMMLALIFYFVFRGGFITGGVNPSGEDAAKFINPFGIAALAGLVGMFSKVASDKLNEVFSTLFRPAPGQGDAKRGDKLGTNPVPSVTSIDPASVKVGTKTVSVIIRGSNFTEKSAVNCNGVLRTSKFISATELSVQLQDTDTAAPSTIEITVSNPAPGGGTSKPMQFKVEP
jgi:hypothetical protein